MRNFTSFWGCVISSYSWNAWMHDEEGWEEIDEKGLDKVGLLSIIRYIYFFPRRSLFMIVFWILIWHKCFWKNGLFYRCYRKGVDCYIEIYSYFIKLQILTGQFIRLNPYVILIARYTRIVKFYVSLFFIKYALN